MVKRMNGLGLAAIMVLVVAASSARADEWKAMNTLCQPGEFKPGLCRNQAAEKMTAMCVNLDRVTGTCDAKSSTDDVKNGRLCFNQAYRSDLKDCDLKYHQWDLAVKNAAELGKMPYPKMLVQHPMYCCVRAVDSNNKGAVSAYAMMPWPATKR